MHSAFGRTKVWAVNWRRADAEIKQSFRHYVNLLIKEEDTIELKTILRFFRALKTKPNTRRGDPRTKRVSELTQRRILAGGRGGGGGGGGGSGWAASSRKSALSRRAELLRKYARMWQWESNRIGDTSLRWGGEGGRAAPERKEEEGCAAERAKVLNCTKFI